MMNFLPHFLDGWTAAAAAAIVVPSLLILYFLKLRRREMPVSSTLLWKKAIQDLQVNAPFQRLRRNLLLFLQMLLLLLLCLALAQPILNYQRGAGPLTVILIDRSASMGATDGQGGVTRLDEAKRRAKELVDTLPRNGVAMVITFDDGAETLQAYTGDTGLLKSAIDSIRQTDRLTSLKLAYEYINAQSAFNPAQNRPNRPRPDVWLFSDGKVPDASTLDVQGTLHFVPIGNPQSKNVAIVALSARRNFEHPTEVEIFARVANYGPDPVRDAQVLLSVNGMLRSASRGNLTLLPESWDEAHRQASGLVEQGGVDFPPLELPGGAVLTLQITGVAGDVLAADDKASLVLPPAKRLAVLLVSDPNPFLDAVLGVEPGLDDFDRMIPEEYATHLTGSGATASVALPKPYDIIVFNGYSPPAIPHDGNFIYFGAIPPDTKLTAEKDDSGNLVEVDNNEVLDWQRDHPIMRYCDDIRNLNVGPMIKLQPTLDSTVLVTGNNGPMIVLHQEGRNRHLVIAFRAEDTDWPLTHRSWTWFIGNALQYLALGTEMNVRQSFQPGATPRIDRVELEKLGTIPPSISLIGPDGTKKLDVPPSGDLVLPPLDHVGLYQTQPPIPGFEQIAVNLCSADESDISPATEPPGGGTDSTIAGGGRARLDLWWWIVACGALPLVMIEWWVYTRRVHL
jgi:hypothetical protein